MTATAGRSLIVAPSWVGDMVMASAALSALKAREPDRAIALLAPPWVAALGRFIPALAQTIPHDIGHGQFALTRRLRIARQLRQERYDRAYILPGSWKSGLIPLLAGIPNRIGLLGEARYGLLTEIVRPSPAARHQIDRYRAILRCADDTLPPRLELNLDDIETSLTRLHLARPVGRLAILAPGAEYGSAKRWPTRHYAALAKDLLAKGWQVWILGSARDAALGAEIAVATDARALNLAGKTEIGDAVALMALADAVISNDSGLAHVAAALGRPTAVIFGPTDPATHAPQGPRVAIAERALDCRPCQARDCPLGHHRCLEELAPERAIAALERL